MNDYRLWEKPIPGVSTPDPSFKILSVPILWQQALVGVIHVFRNETDDNFNQADLEMLELLANHAAIAIENTRMVQEIKSHTADLEERVADRTAELQILVDAMIGREARMADLKDVIRKLRKQIESTGMTPIADDPLKQ